MDRKQVLRAGFTLIEMSIVFVIIGLIVGGILAGKDMINAAEERSVIKERTAIDIAVWTFRDKYGGLPGDLPNATTFWGAAPAAQCTAPTVVGANRYLTGTATCNGDGDGELDNTLSNALKVSNSSYNYSNQLEHLWFWQHLANAGLWPNLTHPGVSDYTSLGNAYDGVPGDNIPQSPLSNAGWDAFGYFNATVLAPTCTAGTTGFWGSCWGGNVIILDSGVFDFGNYPAGGPSTSGVQSAVLSPLRAKAIDTKIDDGYPDSGNVRGSTGALAADSAVGCANNLGSRFDYNAANSSVSCALLFIEGW